MAQLLKNKYNYQSLQDLVLRVSTVYPLFKGDVFISDIIDTKWEQLALKARMRKIAINLGKYLPVDYQQALAIIDQTVASYPPDFNDFTLMYFPDFVEIYGQDECHWDLSMAALARYTSLSSAEFAVRPFIINDEKRMMAQMVLWSKDNNEHVRRLASEGCRPQLPWGQVLRSFKKNPLPILTILEQLKTDPSLYVRKSVANNLNDISKTHPDLIIKLAKQWYGKNKHTDWIVKHGCRTLLKAGNRQVMSLFGFNNDDGMQVTDLALHAKSIAIGQDMTFTFKVTTIKAVKMRLEYGIDYVKANGKRNRKLFQIAEIYLTPAMAKTYVKKHAFANISTRKHYPGIHAITLIVNGIAVGSLEFMLLGTK